MLQAVLGVHHGLTLLHPSGKLLAFPLIGETLQQTFVPQLLSICFLYDPS